MDVVVLAGGKPDPELAPYGVEKRSEITFHGETMLQIVVRACEGIGPVTVVGSELAGAKSVPSGDTFLQSFSIGLEQGTSKYILMASADMPFLTQAAVKHFVDQCHDGSALYYSIVDATLAEQKYPGMRRTVLKLREGTFTGGNLFVLDREVMRTVMPRIESLYANRKNVLKLAGAIGFGTLIGVVMTKVFPPAVGLSWFERKIGKVLGARVRAIPCSYAEIAADIDNSSQVAWLKALEKRG